MECLLSYLSMVTVPHTMVGLERTLDYRGVGLERFHCTYTRKWMYIHQEVSVHTPGSGCTHIPGSGCTYTRKWMYVHTIILL